MGCEMLQIVIAWVVEDIEIVRVRRTDLGEPPVTRQIKVAKTTMWLNEGTAEDVKKAEAYAHPEGYCVYVFAPSVKDARAEAAKLVLK
jgi:hypothetical protein